MILGNYKKALDEALKWLPYVDLILPEHLYLVGAACYYVQLALEFFWEIERIDCLTRMMVLVKRMAEVSLPYQNLEKEYEAKIQEYTTQQQQKQQQLQQQAQQPELQQPELQQPQLQLQQSQQLQQPQYESDVVMPHGVDAGHIYPAYKGRPELTESAPRNNNFLEGIFHARSPPAPLPIDNSIRFAPASEVGRSSQPYVHSTPITAPTNYNGESQNGWEWDGVQELPSSTPQPPHALPPTTTTTTTTVQSNEEELVFVDSEEEDAEAPEQMGFPSASGIWNEDAHMALLADALTYQSNYRKYLWHFGPLHPAGESACFSMCLSLTIYISAG